MDSPPRPALQQAAPVGESQAAPPGQTGNLDSFYWVILLAMCDKGLGLRERSNIAALSESVLATRSGPSYLARFHADIVH